VVVASERVAVLLLLLVACTELRPRSERLDGGPDAGMPDGGMPDGGMPDAGMPDGGMPDAGSDAGPPCVVDPDAPCPPVCARERVAAGESREGGTYRVISSDTIWECDTLPVLVAPTYVEPDVVLTVRAGTEVAAATNAGLLVQNGGRLEAEGSAELPIVFRSETDPSPGSWRGIYLLGDADLGREEPERTIDADDFPQEERTGYGGDDEDHDCGSLRYVQILDAGAGDRIVVRDEMEALRLSGCGRETEVSHVQVHRSFGTPFFADGGSFDADHLVLTEVEEEEGFRFHRTWNGRVQFVVIHLVSRNTSEGIEGEYGYCPTTEERALLANFTVIGLERTDDEAIFLHRGASARMLNFLVEGFDRVFHVQGSTLESCVGPPFDYFAPDKTHLEHSLFDPTTEFSQDEEVRDEFEPPLRDNRSDHTNLPPSTLRDDLVDPDFRPPALAAAASGGASADRLEGLVETRWVGALEPGGEDWTAGWTTF